MPGSWRHGEVFDAIAEAYDARRSGYPREIVAAAVELADLGIGSRVVEVGCGTGKLTEELVACGLRVESHKRKVFADAGVHLKSHCGRLKVA